MPLRFDIEKYLGTNSDGSRSDEYCYYCLKDGKYIVDIPMSEMINIWIKYTDKYNEYADTAYSPEELRRILNERLPKLNRWKQKLETSNIHHQKIQDIVVYINNHLFDSLDADILSTISGLSKYHFRRVFQTVAGENIGSYIQRLRLEHIAHLLVSTDFTLNQISEQTNYQTKFSLAKAFKKHFGVSTSQYREKYKPMYDEQHAVITPEIRSILPMKVFCIEVGEKYKDELRYKLIWDRLTNYARQHNEEKDFASSVRGASFVDAHRLLGQKAGFFMVYEQVYRQNRRPDASRAGCCRRGEIRRPGDDRRCDRGLQRHFFLRPCLPEKLRRAPV